MYYLVVRNLGVEKCIHSAEEDIYSDGMSFSCSREVEFPGGTMIREVSIQCTEVKGPPLKARVFLN